MGLVLGTITGAMGFSTVGFFYVLKMDLYGKIILDVTALILLIRLALHLKREPSSRDAFERARGVEKEGGGFE